MDWVRAVAAIGHYTKAADLGGLQTVPKSREVWGWDGVSLSYSGENRGVAGVDW